MTGPLGLEVLAVGHDASRTGAPVILLSVVRSLVADHRVDLHTVLLDGGPLVDDFAAVAPCTVLGSRWSRAARTVSLGLASVGVRRGVPDPALRLAARRLPVPDVVLANTLAALGAAIELTRRPGHRPRLVCHVHELDGVADRLLPVDPTERRAVLHAVDQFIAAGRPVADMLVDRMGVSAARVDVVDEFIELPRPDPVRSAALASELGGDTQRPIVLDVGAMHRRKGPERFVDLMGLLASHPTRPSGVWLGGDPGSTVWAEVADDVVRSGVPEAVRMVPNVADPVNYLAAADVVVSTAIEDPYPLVVLEAAALGVPVVGFDSGGLAEVLRGAGCSELVCGVGDLLAARDRVGALLADPDLRGEMGERLRDWVLATHLAEHQLPRLWAVLAP